ncbi:MAG: DUF4249 domain-containing protein [Rikenellaceae bacterium]
MREMLKIFNVCWLAALLLSLGACGDLEPEYLDFEATLVLDGSIYIDEYPEIVVTQLVPPDSELSDYVLSLIPISWAKVTLYCEDESESLVGTSNDKYLSNFYYQTLKMKGEQGKQYTLEVEYQGIKVSATTTMLSPVALDSVWCEKVSETDSGYLIKVKIDEPLDEQNYYLISSRVSGESEIYQPTMFGVWSDTRLNTLDNTVPVFRATSILMDGDTYDIFYRSGEKVELQVSNIDKDSYDYYLDLQELSINIANPIYPVTTNARSNVDGGLGIFSGKASSYYTIIIP